MNQTRPNVPFLKKIQFIHSTTPDSDFLFQMEETEENEVVVFLRGCRHEKEGVSGRFGVENKNCTELSIVDLLKVLFGFVETAVSKELDCVVGFGLALLRMENRSTGD